jgi:hypothetical protein
MSSDTLSGIKSIADHLGVPPSTLRRLVKLLGCPVLVIPGQAARYLASRTALDDWARRYLKKPPVVAGKP